MAEDIDPATGASQASSASNEVPRRSQVGGGRIRDRHEATGLPCSSRRSAANAVVPLRQWTIGGFLYLGLLVEGHDILTLMAKRTCRDVCRQTVGTAFFQAQKKLP